MVLGVLYYTTAISLMAFGVAFLTLFLSVFISSSFLDEDEYEDEDEDLEDYLDVPNEEDVLSENKEAPKKEKLLNCPNCGAPIHDKVCKYCGTEFA